MVGFLLKVLYGQIGYVISYYRFMFIRAVGTSKKESGVRNRSRRL